MQNNMGGGDKHRISVINRDTHIVWFMKSRGKEKAKDVSLLFLDEKKQKSSDYIIC